MHTPSKKQLIAFYVLALAIVIAVMAASFLSGQIALLGDLFNYLETSVQYPNVVSIGSFALLHNPWALMILVFAAAPSLAAITVAAGSRGGQLRHLLGRLKPVGPDNGGAGAMRVYMVLFGLYGLILAAYITTTLALADQEVSARMLDSLGGTLPFILLWCIVAPFLDEGGMLEELGWRGFAWQGLQARMTTPLVAALVLGILWWAWHLPRDIPGLLGGQELSTFLFNQGIFLLLCISETIVCCLAVNLTGGSVLPAILVHGGSNVWSKAAATEMYALTGIDVRTLIMVLAALSVIWLAGPMLGRAPHKQS